jgi:hypothetical protein
MYITLDVVFHEDAMYFSYKSDLQEGKQNEVLSLGHDIDVHEEIKLFEDEGGSSCDDDQEVEITRFLTL